MRISVSFPAMRSTLALLTALGCTSVDCVAAADYLNPYASDVGRAIAPDPGTPRQPLDLNGGETPTCRQMRIELERARNAPPAQRPDSYPEGPRRDGLPNQSRRSLSAAPPVYGPLQQLENRYRQECAR